MSTPFVTCICVTRNRPHWLELAVEYFLAQTFTDSELLILLDGDPLAKSFSHPRIRPFHVASVPVVQIPSPCGGFETRPNLGAKRNMACEKARGTVIAVWDDDDYYAPVRLEDQLLTMKRTGKAATGYNKMKFTDGDFWWMYNGVFDTVGIGSSLMFTKLLWSTNKFPNAYVCEDSTFVHHANKRREFVGLPASSDNARPGHEPGDKMYATVHRANTSPRDLPAYRPMGQKRLPDRVVGVFRAADAAFGGPGGGAATEPSGSQA